MEIPISKAQKPKAVSVNPDTLRMDGRNVANIPSLRKQNSSKPTKRLKVKKMPDVFPALEQLFTKDEIAELPPVEPVRPAVNETETVIDQVMSELGKPKKPKAAEPLQGPRAISSMI